jgi:hypothetical protein
MVIKYFFNNNFRNLLNLDGKNKIDFILNLPLKLKLRKIKVRTIIFLKNYFRVMQKFYIF